MKKTITIIALAALFVSCAKEAEQTPSTSGNVITVAPTEFSATLETPEPDTKTTLGTNGKTVLWEEGDSISVWPRMMGGYGVKYTLSSGAGTNSATFTTDQTIIGDGTDRPNLALYPFDPIATLYPEGITTSLPETQNYRANSWDRGAMWMLAVTENAADNNLKFKNLSGVLSLSLKGTAIIESIRVYALDEDERLAGWLYINTSDYGLEFLKGKSSSSLTLECESGVALSGTDSTVFNIVVPPITGGFRVDIYDREHGVMMLQSNSEIKRNTILKMPVVDYAPKAKDLGLSVYWATCNVGEGDGDYFAWGETSVKDTCEWNNYRLTLDGGSTFTKYNGMDGKNVLESADDAAYVKWGSAWRMPTIDEWESLLDENNCKWKWTTTNGVSGYNVVSEKNGASIFLPAAGYRDGYSLSNVGSYGYYWSSSLDCDGTSYARYLYFDDSEASMYGDSRYLGQPVRPVASKGIIIDNTVGAE